MESAKVAARTNFISSTEELDAALTLAGDNLVMLGLISDEACEGFTDEQAKECRQITASMARIARMPGRDVLGMRHLVLFRR